MITALEVGEVVLRVIPVLSSMFICSIVYYPFFGDWRNPSP